MHSCKSNIGLRLEPVYYHSTASWYQQTAGFSLDSSKRFETEKIRTLTLDGSRLSKMVRYAAPVCSSVVPSGLDLFIAQPMNPVKTPCLLGQCFRPRLLACSANASGQDSSLDLGLVEYPGQRPFFPAPPHPLRRARPSPCFVGLLE
jgi:hypothetical protein